MKSKKTSGFTLIELLGVLTIMAILMAITIPSFKGIGRTKKMDAAVNQLRTALSLARQYAILNRATVNILIPDPALITSFSPGDVDKCLSAYAIYDRSNDKYISEWYYLPKGIAFDCFAPASTPPSGIGAYPNALDYTTTKNLPFPSDGAVNKTFVDIDFRSDGSSEIKNPVMLYLTEATLLWPPSGIGLDPTNPSQFIQQPGAATNAIVIYPTAGRLEVIRDF
ncbi:MAG: prepilin-type N-terminal cleavage/methylation domain-containing protein [Kiritimatiellae bacterium]|nr:prepilin-type N-terminal cleavage/methylation domain-containing protein [Kiritimatiellia bacterium]